MIKINHNSYLIFCKNKKIKPYFGSSLSSYVNHLKIRYELKWKSKIVVKNGQKAIYQYPHNLYSNIPKNHKK